MDTDTVVEKILSCLVCCYSKEANMKCNLLSAQFRAHEHVGINKLGRFCYLPTGEEHEVWRHCILQRLDVRTKSRVQPNRRYRIAAHHFPPECIRDHNSAKFLIKFAPRELVTRKRYRALRFNFVVQASEYPHGSKSTKLWYSMPEESLTDASLTLSIFVS